MREPLEQHLGDEARVAADEPAHVRMRRRGRDVDLHDARAGGEQLPEAHRELVEARAEHDRHVGGADELHRRVGAEPARHAEVEFAAGKDAAPERRRRGEGTRRVGERPERLARTGEPRAAAREQHGAAGGCQGARELVDRRCGERRRGGERGGQVRRGQLRGIRSLARVELRDVVRDREHRRHAIREGVLDRDDGGGRGIRPSDGIGACADGRRERDLVDVPRARARGRLIADDEDERHVRLHRLGERREGVGETGAVGGGRGREPAARAEVRVGGDDAPGLVPHRGVGDVGRALERVEEVRVAVPHHPEDVVDVAGEGQGDVRGDGGRGAPWRRER